MTVIVNISVSQPLLFVPSCSWEQERSRRRRKWRADRRKESFSKEESEKDSDCPESPPDSTETQEVAMARENVVTLIAEQNKIREQKVGYCSPLLSPLGGATESHSLGHLA